MPDLFVSYARKDKAFARELCEAMEKRSRDVWIDWEDIPHTSTWLDEVFDGIESSDVFVAIVTPDLAASRVCGLELARAVERGKRIVPILRRDVEKDTPLHPVLRSTDWIWARDTDDFTKALAYLETALEIDLDWLHAHTRLTVRARDWKARLEDRSRLLRGADLKEAERWLRAAASKKSPEATPLLLEYVARSRVAQTRFRRILSAVAASGLAIAAGLGVAAWIQNLQARSRALAGAAVSRLSGEPEAALRLADEAGAVWPTEQAEAALRHGLLASHLRRTLSGHEAAVRTAVFSPDDVRLLTTSEDGTARLWRLDAPGPPIVLGKWKYAPAAAFSADGGMIATAGYDGTVRLADTADGAERRSWKHGEGIDSAAFDATGRFLLTLDQGFAVQVWNAEGGSLRWSKPGFGSAVFSPDGSRVAASSSNEVVVFDTSTGDEVLRLPPHPFTVFTAAFTPDGARILSSWDFGGVAMWDAKSGRSVATLSGHEDPVARIAVDPSRRHFATSTRWVHTESGGGPTAIGDKTVRVWDLDDGSAISVLRGHSREINAIAFSPDGALLVSASGDQTARVWDPETGRSLRVLRGHAGPVASAAFSHDGARIVTAGADGTVRLWESGLGRAVSDHAAVPTEWRDAGRFDASGRFLTLPADGGTRVIDVETGRGTPLPAAADESGVRVQLSPDGQWMVTVAGDPATASGAEEAKIFEARTGRKTAALSHGAPVYSARFDASSARVVTVGEDATARLWAAPDGRELARLEHGDRVLDAVFSHRGDRVATASRDTTAVIWDAEAGMRLAELHGHEDAVLTAAFSPDDRLVASVGADNTVRIWEPETGEQLAAYRWDGSTVLSVAFSSDCRWLTVRSDLDAAQRFPCEACGDVDDLRAVVKARDPRTAAILSH